MNLSPLQKIIKVGIVGTGYAAKKRAEALQADPRAEILQVAGNTPEKVAKFCQTFSVTEVNSWQELVSQPELDLIVICTINRDHGAIARSAIENNKHVVIEYPLSLDPQEAAAIITLAQAKNKLIHVEHIELIGGIHQTLRQYLPEIGNIFYARYTTIAPKYPPARRWNYHKQMWGFPLSAALSRVHRLTDILGNVATVSCQSRYWDAPEAEYFNACLCNAQLRFVNGAIAEISYGKGDVFWHGYRHLEIYGDQGTISFMGEKGSLIKGEETITLPVKSRRGLFVQDTSMVLDYLTEGQPLYVKPQASLYALQVADAARRSADSNQVVQV
ncbi:MAG: Gfo/Idh/MocA family oxidoreductase [Xenococcaceae cyanobacterium MO_188.B29]|nr:Gfo/Idh/MocA family oxidoreductase [Xenococcaceae cyanobacterium MO_188.B29]